MRPGSWAGLLPPFLLGGALAAASIVAAGLLLYGGPGFLRALSVVLATLLGALAAGVLAGSGAAGVEVGGRERVESLRRRWLLTLVAFALAAVFSATWEGFRGFGALALTQGLGLAFLGALPLFAGGSVLGTLAGLPVSGRAGRHTGPAALAGAAVGALVIGFVLFPTFSPTATLLICLVTLSGAALLHGRALDEVTWVLGSAASHSSERVRIERWFRGRPPLQATAVFEDGRLRTLIGEKGAPVRSMDRAVAEALPRWRGGAGRALVLGAGGAAVAGLLAGSGPGEEWDVVLVEENPAVLGSLGGTLASAIRPRAVAVEEVLAGSPAHLPPSAFDLVFLDTLSLAARPAEFRFPPGALLRLAATLRDSGILVVGPLQDGGTAGSLLDATRHLAAHFSRVSLYVAGRTLDGEVHEVPADRLEAWRATRGEAGSRPAFLVAGRGGPMGWPDRVSGYLRVMLEEAGRG